MAILGVHETTLAVVPRPLHSLQVPRGAISHLPVWGTLMRQLRELLDRPPVRLPSGHIDDTLSLPPAGHWGVAGPLVTVTAAELLPTHSVTSSSHRVPGAMNPACAVPSEAICVCGGAKTFMPSAQPRSPCTVVILAGCLHRAATPRSLPSRIPYGTWICPSTTSLFGCRGGTGVVKITSVSVRLPPRVPAPSSVVPIHTCWILLPVVCSHIKPCRVRCRINTPGCVSLLALAG